MSICEGGFERYCYDANSGYMWPMGFEILYYAVVLWYISIIVIVVMVEWSPLCNDGLLYGYMQW